MIIFCKCSSPRDAYRSEERREVLDECRKKGKALIEERSESLADSVGQPFIKVGLVKEKEVEALNLSDM